MKKLRSFKSFTTIAVSSFLLLSSLFTSCEIGLGSAVDIDPPSVVIEGPRVDAVIRNKFALYGTWKDDGTVEELYVILKRTDGKLIDGTNVEKKIDGELFQNEKDKNSGTWRVIVDPLDEDDKLFDGTVQAIVHIIDKSKHETTQSTTLTLDNTPPVIVITRPSTALKAKSFDTYGQLFTLEGQAADDNNVNLIEVRVYNDKDCTEFKHAIALKNVPNSINLDAAVYDKDKGGYISQDEYKYNFEVPLQKAGEGKEFYCKIVAYDGAESFPIDGSLQSEDDKKGNPVDYYYLYKDIASVILQNYKINEVYHILNGSFTDNSRSAIAPEDVIELINSDELKTSVGKFILNPTNNPTFQITGRSPLLLEGNDFTDAKNDLSNGGQIVVEVSPGLDGIPLEEESLKVYAQKCDKNGKVLPDAPKIYPTNPTLQESGTSYRFTLTIRRSEGFEIGGNYIVGVEGHDQSTTKNPVEPAGKAFGFHLASSGNAPSLEVTSPASGTEVYKREGQSQIFSGTIQVEAGVPVLNVYKAGSDDPIITKEFTEADAVNRQSKNEYSFSEEFSDFGDVSGRQVFRFVASLEGVPSPTIEREIIYDVKAPGVTISQPQLANKYDDAGHLDTSAKYVNGNISFEVSAKDKGGASLGNASNPTEAIAKYEVIVGEEAVLSGNINLDNEEAVSINTTDAKINGKTFIFRVTVQDNAGNYGISNDQDYTYIADQSTDIPYFVKHDLTADERAAGKKDLDFTMTEIAAYNALDKSNKLGTVTKGDYLKFKCYDDDGNVRITIKNKRLLTNSQADWENNINNLKTVFDKSKDTKSLVEFDDYQFPNSDDECGFYEYVIILSDGSNTITRGPFLVNVAKNHATIKVEAKPEYAKDGKNFENKITITSSSMPPYSAYRKIGEETDPSSPVTSVNIPVGTANENGIYEFTELEITDNLNASELAAEEESVYYYLVDGNNQKSNEFKVSLKKDNDAPETLTITAPSEGKTEKQSVSDDDYAFRGEARDSKSGVKYIYYYFGGEEETTAPGEEETTAPVELSAYTKIEASNGNYIINKIIDNGTAAGTAGNLFEGKWKLYIKAEDVAGNVTETAKSRAFEIDKAAPELTENGEDDLGYKNADFTLSGSVIESNGFSESDGFIIKDDKSDKQWTVTATKTSEGNYSWSQEIKLSDFAADKLQGKHTLTITAKDKATKTTSLKRIVTIDSVAPQVSDEMSLPNGYSFDAAVITLSGTAGDVTPSSGLKEVKYYFTDALTNPSHTSDTFTAEGQAYWSASIQKENLTNDNMGEVFAQQGTKYITVIAYDNAGNASDPVTKEFVYDTGNPEISDLKIKYESQSSETALGSGTIYTKEKGYTISGKFSDLASNVTMSVTCNGNPLNAGEVTQTADSENPKAGSWSFTTSNLDDGNYNYIITATDASGRNVRADANIVVDATLPEVQFTETEDIYIKDSAYTLHGSVTDANLKEIKAYRYKDGSETPEKDADVLNPVKKSENEWDWNWTLLNLSNGEYSVKVEATDEAVNTGSKSFVKKFIVDTVKPEVTVAATNLKNNSGNDVTSLSKNGNYFTGQNSFDLTISVSESYLNTLTIQKDSGDAETITTENNTALKTVSESGTYTITATDIAGNSDSFVITVTVDTAAPEILTITAPNPESTITGQSALTDNTYIFRGIAKDKEDGSGTGLAKLLYKFVDATKDGADQNNADYNEIAASDGSWSITKTINDGPMPEGGNLDSNLYEGKYYLYIKAQDKAGNTTEAQSIRFDFDKKDPVNELTASIKDIYNTSDIDDEQKGQFTLSGKAGDSYGLASFGITYTAGSQAQTLNPEPAADGSYSVEFNFGSGNSSISEGYYLADGNYTFTIKATDLVGKEKTITKAVKIDTSAPELSNIKVNNEVYSDTDSSSKWYNTTDMKITGDASDNLGISEVYYLISNGKNGENNFTWASEEHPFIGGSSWKGTVSDLVSKETAIKIIAKDDAGNIAEQVIGPWNIDMNAPALVSVTEGDTVLSESTSYYSNTTNDINLTITVKDTDSNNNPESGVDRVYVLPYEKWNATKASTYVPAIAETEGSVYTYTILKEALQSGTIYARIYDKAGNYTDVNLFAVTVDTAAPVLQNYTLKQKIGQATSDAYKNSNGYYINNKREGASFILSGIATDNLAIASVNLVLSVGGEEKFNEEITSGEWAFENIDMSSWGDNGTRVTGTITVTDMAGNTQDTDKPISSTFTITFDTTPPVSIHEIDDKLKDLYFRIGNANNDDITKTNAGKYGLTWSKEDDEGVGNKYSNGAYGNDLTIQIRGNFDDGENGSGVKKIYYQVRDSETLISALQEKEGYAGKTEEEVLALFAKEIAENTSDTKSFSPLESSETKRVFYNSRVTTDQTSGETTYDGNVGGRIRGTVTQLIQQGTPEKPTAKFYKDVVTTYKNSITGFKEGNNYVILVVEDNVGNLSLDVARDVPYKDKQGQAHTGNFINYSLNVDTAVPEITSDNADVLYTNKKGYVELSGRVNDDGAGLGSLKFNLNNTELEVYNTEEGDVIPDDLTQITKCLVTITTTESGPNEEKRKNTWNIKIPSSKFTDSETTYTVYAIAKDKAGTGNETKESVGTIKVDTAAPAITIASPKANSQVNKEIIFSGSISDGTNSAGIDTSAEKAPKLYWTTDPDAKDSSPDPEALEENAKDGWVELALSTAEAPSALTAKTWNTTSHEWTFTVDTEKLKADGSNVVPNGTTAYFTISASDKAGSGDTAGNTGYAPVHALIIDQNSDRPIIKFSNLDISSMTDSSRVWITKEELYASVTDDDGEVESVKISFDGTNWSDQDAQGNKYYTKENGLSITLPSDKDGEQQIWFKVTDAKDTTFTSSTTTDAAVTTAPKLAYKNVEFGATPATETTPARYYSMLYAKIDLGDPAIPLVYYTTVNDDSTPIENKAGLANLLSVNNSDELTESAKENWHDLTGVKTAIGGPAKAIYIFVKAKDANGISQITPTFTTSVTLNDNEKPVITTPITDTVDNEKSSIALIKIDISKCTGTNDYKFELRSTDNANRSISRSFDMSIDKESPVVYIDSPAENAELYGTAGLPNSNVTVRGRSDADVSKIYMAVTKGGAEEPDSLEEGNYIDITKSNGISWSVIFNGNKGGVSTTDFYEDRFNTWVDTLWGSGTSEDPSISEKEICLWFYAEDKLGNKGIESPKKLPLKIFTQGDRPTVAITSPDQGGQVGGIITVTGSTSIAIKSVENIWLQIDSNYNGSSFNENWETALTGSGGLLEGKTPEQLGYIIEDSGNTTIGRAIKAGGSKTSWNLAINKASEFNKADNSNRNMAIRAYAISSTGKPSNPVIVSFTLDPNAPVFGQLPGQALRLVQYADNEHGLGLETASRLYESGIDLKGKWWLTGSVSDDSGIVSLQKVTKDVTENVLTNCTATGAADAETHCYNYIMKIPLSGEGKLETKLIAQEGANTNKTSEFPIILNFDNAEPLFECTSLSETEAKQIYQSDGVYEIRGTFNDNSGSDFKRIAFYVTRTVGGIDYLTDVMIKQGENLTDNSYVLSTLQHTNNDNKDLYWQTLTECKIQNGTEILIKKTLDELPLYIRRGAVCRINNILYRINKIELNTDITNNSTYPIKLVVDSKINDAESISVDFALAQIIDNTIKEQGKTNTYDSSYDIGANSNQEKFDNDDNDQMVERYSETSGEWTVSIDSNNIKDGAITIHFVAYDKAGNITYKSYNGVVANNVPRFAGVKFGTDVNGDGKVEGDEIKNTYTGWYNIDPENKNKKDGITENGSAATGEKITLWAIPSKNTDITQFDETAGPAMTIKGKLTVIPEIVGGNDGLGWNYKINTGNYIYNEYKEMTGAGHSGSTEIRPTNLTTFEIPDYELISKTSDGINIFTFTISDKTGGTIGGDSASKANLLIKFDVALKDEEAPTSGIKPFYWKSSGKGNNSLYYENNSSIAQGHIELPQDLPDTFTYKEEGSIQTGLNDIDPKVSGKIYLEGFAQDNVVVEKLLLRAYKKDQQAGDFVEVAARNRITPTEQNPNPNYGNFVYVSAAAAQGFIGFERIKEETITKDGKDYNRIEWKVAIDTSILTGNVADTDIIIEVQAKDRGPASASGQEVSYGTAQQSAASTLQTGLKQNAEGTDIALTANTPTFDDSVQTPYYRVDVVPYVTTIETALSSGLKSSIKDAYSRTALGHYIAREREKILINGFNLAGGTVTFIKNDTETCSADYDISGISIPDDAKSGKMSVKVNSVETLNNINDNNACGAYKTETTQITEDSPYADKAAYAYNRMPNRTSNNLLTDDLVIDIWELDSDAAKPMSGELREPSMKINPVTGQVGLAFVSGPANIAMADSTNSYMKWQQNFATYNNISFAYDALGNAHSTATGLDTNPQKKHAGRFSYFYNKWGPSGLTDTSSYDGLRAVRLESIAVPKLSPIVKTTFTMDDYNTVQNGGTVYEELTRNLLVNGSIPDSDSLTETRFYSPSLAATVHGTGDSATTAVYLAYYDSTQKQIRFRYSSEMPQTWNAAVTYENMTKNADNTITVDPDYKEEWISGALLEREANGKYKKDGGFTKLHHGKNDKDDFVDNLGYFAQTSNAGGEFFENYMEANTDHFSLIAGVDYQQNEIVTTTQRDYTIDQVEYIQDDEGNDLYAVSHYKRVTGVNGNGSPIVDSSDKGKRNYEIREVPVTQEMLNDMTIERRSIPGYNKTKSGDGSGLNTRFTLNQMVPAVFYDNFFWLIQPDGLINFANTDPSRGWMTYKVSDIVPTVDTAGHKLNPDDEQNIVYERVDDISELNDFYALGGSGDIKYFWPYSDSIRATRVTSSCTFPVTKKTVDYAGYDTGYRGYKYVAIDAITGDTAAEDKVVAVWYDGTRCLYAYNKHPTAGKDNGQENGWEGTKVIFSEGGEHCTVKFDPNGGVHIAAYADGSLRYAYLPRYDADYNESTDSVLVDSFTITGERINLDVGLEQVRNTSKYVAVPYITYYNGTARKPTVAKLVIPETLPEDYKSVIYKAQGTGTNDGRDIFTGNWEISLVPTASTLTSQYYDKMNIGLWKVGNTEGETRQKGLIVASNDSKFTISKNKTSENNSSATNQGNIYGNGTANPIVGYAVESTSGTFFETAQMK